MSEILGARARDVSGDRRRARGPTLRLRRLPLHRPDGRATWAPAARPNLERDAEEGTIRAEIHSFRPRQTDVFAGDQLDGAPATLPGCHANNGTLASIERIPRVHRTKSMARGCAPGPGRRPLPASTPNGSRRCRVRSDVDVVSGRVASASSAVTQSRRHPSTGRVAAAATTLNCRQAASPPRL